MTKSPSSPLLNLRKNLHVPTDVFTSPLAQARFKIELLRQARSNPRALALKVAFYLEEATILARRARGTEWEDHYFDLRYIGFRDLLAVCKTFDYKHGTQGRSVRKVLCVDLPDCKQLSWYILDYDVPVTVKSYKGQWDRMHNENLKRIAAAAGIL